MLIKEQISKQIMESFSTVYIYILKSSLVKLNCGGGGGGGGGGEM